MSIEEQPAPMEEGGRGEDKLRVHYRHVKSVSTLYTLESTFTRDDGEEEQAKPVSI